MAHQGILAAGKNDRSVTPMFDKFGSEGSTTWFRGLRRSCGLMMLAAGLSSALARNAPQPQSLPYLQDFGSTAFSTLPPGVAAWNGLNGAGINTRSLAESSSPTGNAPVTTATSPQEGGGGYGYATDGNARFYIQTSGNSTNGVNQLAIAVNTTGWQSITLSYDLEIVIAETRTIGVICQYRLGNAGSWTSLAPASGPNPFSQSGGTTGPKGTVTIHLPPAASQQPEVQIRWALWRGTEGGNSSGLAIDNISVTGTGFGTPPDGYYDAAEGLTGASLRTALQAISANGQTPIDFGDTFNPLRAIHEDPDNSSNVITVYSGNSLGKFEVFFPGGDRDPDLNWDREHLWPVSYGLNPGNAQGPSYSDLFNLRPAISSVNSLRGNLYFDNSSDPISVPALAPLCSYDDDSWKPRDSEKGDIARAMFYLATRYDGSDPGTINLQLADTPGSPASSGRFAKLSTLLLWHAQDPVSEEEQNIHQRIVSYQGNRNPFVDRPDFVPLLWGELLAGKTTATVTEGGAGDSYTITLTSEPFADVTVQISDSPAGQLLVSPSSITFNSQNWNLPQLIQIEAIDDDVHEGTMTVTLSHQVVSTDPYHASQTLPPVEVTVIDNDPLIAPTSLPLTFGGPWSPLPAGFLAENLGPPYALSLGGDSDPGSARFDNSGASLTVAFDSSPALVSYHLKGNTGGEPATSGTFRVLESPDGQQFTLVRELINKNTADEPFSDPLHPDTRFLRFLYLEKSTGNIQLDKLAITALPSLTPWEEWLAGYQLNGADALADADPDGDGLGNLAEYALGRSPVAADPPSTAPVTEKIPGKIRITAVLRISDPALSSTAETTTKLNDPLSWTETGVTRSTAEDQTGVAVGFERTIFEIDDDDAATRFARLRFSL